MTNFKSREDKIAFLNAVLNKKRSLDEIIERKRTWLFYEDENGDVIIKGHAGVITREDARKIRNRCTNPKGGHHLIFGLCADCDPIIDNEEN